jgi:hypothetical protein
MKTRETLIQLSCDIVVCWTWNQCQDLFMRLFVPVPPATGLICVPN